MLTILANAKLNLFLRVTGRRENGYHDLDMVMQKRKKDCVNRN